MSEIVHFSDLAQNTDLPTSNRLQSPAEMQQQNIILNAAVESDIFSLSRVQFEFKGRLAKMIVRNNVLLMGLSHLHILRIDLLKPQIIEDIEIPKKGNDTIANLFLDPHGRHCIIVLTSGDVFYHFSAWKKAKPLSKLRNLGISCVEWTSTIFEMPRSGSTGPILIGTKSGKIIEAELEPSEEYFRREERYVREVGYINGGFTGIAIGRFQDSVQRALKVKLFVICTTENCIYQFTGDVLTALKSEPVFDQMFRRKEQIYQELPGELGNSMLTIYQSAGVPKSLAWLTAPGIYMGDLNVVKSDNSHFIENVHIMPFPADVVGPDNDAVRVSAPVSIALSQFHFLLLYRDRLKAISKLDDEVVFDQELPEELKSGCLFAMDDLKNTFWIYSESCMYELVITDEDKDVWQIYLKKLQFDMALEFAKTDIQKNQILNIQAAHYFNQERFLLAASLYGQSNASFEKVLLKFFSIRNKELMNGEVVSNDTFQESIQRYLIEKFKRLQETTQSKLQKQVISALLLDLRLGCGKKIDEWIDNDDLRQGLIPKIAYQLFSRHGEFDKMISYASKIGDFDKVMRYHVERKDWKNAVNTVAKQTSDQTVYKYFSLLMRNAPEETVKFLFRNPQLKLNELIRGILGADTSSETDLNTQSHAIRFLESRIIGEGNKDPAVHNFLVSLYVLQRDQEYTQKLITYLKSGERKADLQYALRLCNQWKLYDACIVIYGELNLFEEAVDVALKLQDLELAEIYANKAQDNEPLRKKLWMRIARHLINSPSGSDVQGCLRIIRDSNAVTIEDVLGYLPDDVLVDDIKDELVSTLKEYRMKMDEVKMEMNDATKSSEELRRDIEMLKKRFIRIPASYKCSLCKIPLMTSPFYCFPCDHHFHRKCLMSHVVDNFLTAPMQQRVFQLESELKLEAEKMVRNHQLNKSTFQISQEFTGLKQEFDDLVASDCVQCGSIIAKNIDKPFISASDETVASLWTL